MSKIYFDPARPLSLDLETNTADWPVERIEVRLVGLGNRPCEAACFQYNEALRPALARVLREARVLVGQNIAAFDQLVLEEQGFEFHPDLELRDIMLAHHLLWPTLPHDLGTLGRQYTSKPYWKDWRGSGDLEELYCCRDVDGALQIHDKLWPELARDTRLLRLYRLIQLPLARMCAHMSQNGITRDPAQMQRLRERTQAAMEAEEANLPSVLRTFVKPTRRREPAPAGTLGKSGKPLKFIMVDDSETVRPWASAPQVAAWLYDTQGYPEELTAKGSRASGKVVLDKLAHRHPEDRGLGAIRKLRTLASRLNYCPTDEGGNPLTHAETLHPSFLPHGTNTGRLASSGPNIQNWEEDVRCIVVPSQPGWVLWSADYSQIEPRLTAWFSEDAERAARYDQPGFNEHKFVCALFFKLPYEAVVKDNSKDAPYGKAKRINNGANYLLGARTMAKMNDWDLAETQRLCNTWKRLMPKAVEWQQRVVAEVVGGPGSRGTKMLYNPFGRRGLFYAPGSGPAAVAYNPQSTAADIIFRAMLGLLYERIRWPRAKVAEAVRVIRPLPRPARVIAQVHDQLLGECPREALADVLGTVREVMTQPWPELSSAQTPNGLAIPVSPEWGETWGDMEAYKF